MTEMTVFLKLPIICHSEISTDTICLHVSCFAALSLHACTYTDMKPGDTESGL